MSRSIIITDLTRFSAGKPTVCIAGIDPDTGECIRPMPYLSFTECERLQILPGGRLVGNFTPSPHRSQPHMEDCQHSNLQFRGPCTADEFRGILERSCVVSLAEGFGYEFPDGDRCLPAGHSPGRSIVTLRASPNQVRILENDFQPGSIRLHFTDGSGRGWRYFPITDLGFFDYAQRHRQSGALEALNAEIASQEDVFLRVGLSRVWQKPYGEKGYWMQVNGIYTFPRVLRYIRSYSTPKV